MKLLGIATKPLSEVFTNLKKDGAECAVLTKYDEEQVKDIPYILCPDIFVFKKHYKKLVDTDKIVLVFDNILMLTELVNIDILDVKHSLNSSAYVSKPIDYLQLVENPSVYLDVGKSQLKHLPNMACLMNTKVKGRFFKLLYDVTHNSNVGVKRNTVLKLVYDYLFGLITIKELDKNLELYKVCDDYTKNAINKLIKYFKSEDSSNLKKACKDLYKAREKKLGIDYSKLESIDCPRIVLKTIVRQTKLIEDGKYNLKIGA